VQLLLPALEVYLPLQQGEAGAVSSSGAQQQQQQPQSPGARRPGSAGRLRRSNSGGSAAAGRSGSSSRGRTSFEGSLKAAAAGEVDSVLQAQHGALLGADAAAEALQKAVSRALGVGAAELTYYAVQQTQLPDLLQQQQQQKQTRSSSSHGSGKPRSRGPSPLRGSNSSGGKGQQPSLLLQQQQQELSVVVGFRDGSCGFSLANLEELLVGTAAEGTKAQELRLKNQQLEVRVMHGRECGEGIADAATVSRACTTCNQELFVTTGSAIYRCHALLCVSQGFMSSAVGSFSAVSVVHFQFLHVSVGWCSKPAGGTHSRQDEYKGG
jgi:hypothetical protein